MNHRGLESSAPRHRHHTRARTKEMESAIEQLEQQNQELRTENQRLKEEVAKIQEQLTKGHVERMTRVYETPRHPPGFTPQYGMPLGWNDNMENQQQSRQPEQAGQSEAQGSGPGPRGPFQPPPFEINRPERMKWDALEERVRAIEGTGSHGLDATDLCLVPNITLPPDFKMPKFEKYKGSSCPRVHLAMYCRKMAAYHHQDSILIHCFQESLTGAALRWFVGLESGHIKTWRDLADAFVRQYKYNEDMAPDRSRLQNLSKKDSEDFKEYAQRWRELAAQVQPPLPEREMVTMFIDTLPPPYFDKTVGSVASSFADLIKVVFKSYESSVFKVPLANLKISKSDY
ncbi:hypothetical protein CR513_61217, partial [Mucuna pruriens]